MIYYYPNNIKLRFKQHFTPLDTLSVEKFVYIIQLKDQTTLQYTVPEEIINPVKEKRCKILLLGWDDNWGSKEFKLLFLNFKKQIDTIEEDDFVYVTASGEDYSLEKFNHFYANRGEWQWHEIFYPKIVRKSKRFYENKTKDFICLNKRPDWHKFLAISHLWEHRAQGHISHVSKEYNEDQYAFARQIFESCDPFPHVLSKRFKRHIEKHLPFVLLHDRLHNTAHSTAKDIDSPKYLESWIHIVTESRSELYSPNGTQIVDRYVSEKIFKPIFYKQPYILVGQNGILKLMKQWGYQTYDTIFNEKYDNIKENWTRAVSALDQTQKWLRLSNAEKLNVYQEHDSVFEHNFNNLIKRGKELELNLHNHILNSFKSIEL